jgi:DNA-binding NtrC family response regulator
MFGAPPQKIQALEHSVFSSRRHGVVLVVDDEYSTREILSKWIDGAGFEVYTAPDAETALEILAERDIAVVTIDKDMPGHDGMWLIDKIQKRYPHVAMLLATGDDAISPKVSLSRGVLSYLVKPFEPEAVIRAIVVGVRWHFDEMQQRLDNS